MKRALLLFYMLGACLSSLAQTNSVFLFTKDSIDWQNPKWVLVDGDRAEYASPTFDDSRYPRVETRWFRINDDSLAPFNGIAWMRLRFRLDSSLIGKPLALGISHYGASEVYLDGKKIYAKGKIADADHSIYYDPQLYPHPFVIPDSGIHLFAIRYANWNHNNTNFLYHEAAPGFRFNLNEATDAFNDYVGNNDFGAISSCILFGIFGILALIHGLFFLSYRNDRSNLWFSVFCASLAILFPIPYVTATLSSPGTLLFLGYYVFFFAAVLAAFSLSGFLTALFSKRKTRFILLSIIYLLLSLCYLFFPGTGELFAVIIAVIATLESTIVLFIAIVRKVPGARIIGAGLGLFIFLILFLAVSVLVFNKKHFSLSGSAGELVALLVALAIISIPISLSAFLARNFAVVSKDLNKRLIQVEQLSETTRQQELEKQRILEQQKETLEHQVSERTKEVVRQKAEIENQHAALMEEKKKSDDLLQNILPAEVAEELKQKGSSAARQYDQVSVLFTDFVDFTSVAEQMSPQELVAELNECFTAFDAIMEKHGLEKIKTIGDAYMAVCGLPLSDDRHAQKTVQAALAIRDFVHSRHSKKHLFGIRIGINSGAVVAGIVGVKKFAYDIWGDTVNTAARMEQHSEAGRINISGSTFQLIRGEFDCTPRGKVPAKHKGEVEMYFVESAILHPPA